MEDRKGPTTTAFIPISSSSSSCCPQIPIPTHASGIAPFATAAAAAVGAAGVVVLVVVGGVWKSPVHSSVKWPARHACCCLW